MSEKMALISTEELAIRSIPVETKMATILLQNLFANAVKDDRRSDLIALRNLDVSSIKIKDDYLNSWVLSAIPNHKKETVVFDMIHTVSIDTNNRPLAEVVVCRARTYTFTIMHSSKKNDWSEMFKYLSLA